MAPKQNGDGQDPSATRATSAHIGKLEKEWRCRSCGKLLGCFRDGRLHLRFGGGHEYLVGFPVTSVCRGCRALNELRDATPVTALASANEAIATR